VLSIGKIALGQHRYYSQQVAQGRDDYYSGRGEARGEWVGSGSAALGLSGRASSEQFSALIAGHDPRRPELRLRSSDRDPRVAALDLTFSAPKSVSVLAAVGPDELTRELLWAHEDALRAARSYLEDTAVKVRRGHDGESVQSGEGLIAVAYRHRMSRALDPQLHTHVVAANMTRGPDGRYTALHGAPLYRHAKTAGYLYQSHLRSVITERLGLQWGEVHKGAAELQDVPQQVLQEFSKRRHQMLREAQEGGIPLTSKAAAESAAIATRDRKRYGVQTHTWREEVRARASELGLDRAALRNLIGKGQALIRSGYAKTQLIDERSIGDQLAGPEGLTERANTFNERDVLQRLASEARMGLRVEDLRALAQRFTRRPEVIHTARGEMTTSELVASERALIDAALGRADKGVGVIDPRLVPQTISTAAVSLTDEQLAAVSDCISKGDGVSVIEALAGTGKTFTARVLGEIYERAEYEVLGVAPTARAARELTEQARIPSRTLDRLLLDVQQFGDALPRRCVVILDEAGMAPTRSSAKLLQLAERARAKVIAIGDAGQLASVQAGGWLRAAGMGLGAHRLTEVMRQRDGGERSALQALHEREPKRFLRWAQRQGRIESFDSAVVARRQTVEEWHQAISEVGPTQAVMISRDNDTRDALNTAARELWRALGLLGEERTYGRLPLAQGERVICRHNDCLLEVDNGMRGTVRSLDRHRVVIETDSHLLRELPASYIAEHVEHAYALTGHGMQGATVERAIVLASPRELTAGWSYTVLSRARGETRLLIHHDDHGAERTEFAPGERVPTERKADLLARVERHMCERDDEDLAIEQLPDGPDEIEFKLASSDRRHAPTLDARRAAQRLEDLDARTRPLSAQQKRLAQQLEQLRQPLHERQRERGSRNLVRAHVETALAACARELETLSDERGALLGRLDNTSACAQGHRLEHASDPPTRARDTLAAELEEPRATRIEELGRTGRGFEIGP
jgi:conjugative relaxase-like TrwC/TraI family protein